MKLAFSAVIGVIGGITPCYAALTKGYIQIKGPSWEKGVSLSTLFDDYDGDIIASETEIPLQVQLDLGKAQTADSDIKILNGFWTDLYPFLGVSVRNRDDLAWKPPSSPRVGFINVQQTTDAQPQQKENSFTACYPNHMAELPFQASAIWRYDPLNGGKLTPNIQALNGTRLPVAVYGSWFEGSFHFTALAPSGSNGEQLDFYFVSATE